MMIAREKKTVIFARFSEETQRPVSCDDQEREVRGLFNRLGIDHKHALVFKEEAESGLKEARPAYQQLIDMIYRGEVGILGVDDQARLSRGMNVKALITDLVYHGGRFVSVHEGIDTNRPGWEMLVGIMEVHHSNCSRETAHRVRRGQEGRVLDGNGSAGDFPFGYASVYEDDDWQQQLSRGRKPKKVIVVDDVQANIVRIIFHLFGDLRWRPSKIARFLNDRNISKANRGRSTWLAESVSYMLANPKYMGRWNWGERHVIRDSQGHKKCIPSDESEIVRVDRPDLAIVTPDAWEKAQRHRKDLHVEYGKKPGQQRGPRRHWTDKYPPNIFSGLLYCHECGGRLKQTHSKSAMSMRCHNVGCGVCKMTAGVRCDHARTILMKLIGQILVSQTDWIKPVVESLRDEVERLASSSTCEIATCQKRHDEVVAQIDRLVLLITTEFKFSRSLQAKLTELEHEEAELADRLEQLRQSDGAKIVLPGEAWIQEQFRNLVNASTYCDDELGNIARELFGKITVSRLLRPGHKKRSTPRLHIQVNRNAALALVLSQVLPTRMVEHLHQASELRDTVEYVIELEPPSLIDQWAEHVYLQRQQDVPWKTIREETGLTAQQAKSALKRWQRHLDTQAAANSSTGGQTGKHDQNTQQAADNMVIP